MRERDPFEVETSEIKRDSQSFVGSNEGSIGELVGGLVSAISERGKLQ